MGSRRIIGRTFAVGPRDASDTLPVAVVQTKQRQLADLGDETLCEESLLLPRNSQNMRKAATAATASLFILPLSVVAGTFSDQLYNPDNFKPVCAASDSFYRFLQGSTQALVGMDNFVEYGPLISGGLLRVRLELCVVESFFSEAVGPFIKANGLGWILPIHETVETFLAGFIFAVATTFILVGSTKLLAVIVFYGDLLVGVPCRLFGGFAFDRALGKPVTLDIGIGPWKKQIIGPADSQNVMGDEKISDLGNNIQVQQYPALLLSGAVKVVGEVSKVTRELVEGADFFVGRYLTILASGYIALKFLHYKVFPDFPPF